MSEFTIPWSGEGGEEVVYKTEGREVRTRRVEFKATPEQVFDIIRAVFRSLPDSPYFWYGREQMKIWVKYYTISRPKDYYLPRVGDEGDVAVVTPSSRRKVIFRFPDRWEVDFGTRGSYHAATQLKNLLKEEEVNYKEEAVTVSIYD